MSKVHYHFDHVGSYLRPQALKEAREKFADGDISQDELLKVQDELVKDLVHHEVENGLRVVSDGEFGRSWWHLDFLWNLTGFEAYQQEDSYKFHGAKINSMVLRHVQPTFVSMVRLLKILIILSIATLNILNQ